MTSVVRGGGEFVQCGQEGGGSSDANVRIFGAKLRIFPTLWFVRTDKWGEGFSQCGHFVDKAQGEEGSQYFAILCGRLLWTVLYVNLFNIWTFKYLQTMQMNKQPKEISVLTGRRSRSLRFLHVTTSLLVTKHYNKWSCASEYSLRITQVLHLFLLIEINKVTIFLE